MLVGIGLNFEKIKFMIVAIVGSRTFNDYSKVVSVLKNIPADKIVSGGAAGADSLAKQYAINHNIEFQEFPADWKSYGKSAGPIRNKLIVDAADHLIAFWDGKSSGTKHSIDLGIKKGIIVDVINI